MIAKNTINKNKYKLIENNILFYISSLAEMAGPKLHLCLRFTTLICIWSLSTI